MQEHVGDFFKEVIVNQGLAIKDFASLYSTTPSHMSEILGKKDINTSIIRRVEDILKIDFKLVSSIDKGSQIEQSSQYSRIRQEVITGRPIAFKNKLTVEVNPPVTNPEVLIKEIEGLKALLASKDEIIKSKDDLIHTLLANKI